MIRQCLHCQKYFRTTREHKRYCSDACASSHRHLSGVVRVKACIKCGKRITAQGHEGRRVYCDDCKVVSIYESQAKYRNGKRGVTAQPFASLFRDYGSFGALVLVQDNRSSNLLRVKWLCKDVDEQTAWAAIEAWKAER